MRQQKVTVAALTFAMAMATAACAEPQCDDVDAIDGVSLKFCTREDGGVWHVSPKVLNGAATKKDVSVTCTPPGVSMSNVVIDAYEPGQERSVFDATLPGITERPAPYCKFESVKDWAPSTSTETEQ